MMMSEAPERIVAYKTLSTGAGRSFEAASSSQWWPITAMTLRNLTRCGKLESEVFRFAVLDGRVCYAYEAGYPTNKILPDLRVR